MVVFARAGSRNLWRRDFVERAAGMRRGDGWTGEPGRIDLRDGTSSGTGGGTLRVAAPETGSSGGGPFMDLRTFREMGRAMPAGRRPQAWWDLFSVLGGVAAAVLWSLYAGINAGSEGFDFLSPALMIGIPVVLALKRESIDGLLQPLQPYRRRFPSALLIGAGLAVPFLTAFLLYNLFGISEYALMYTNLVVGTFCSYALIRNPPGAAGGPPQRAGGAKVGISLLLFCLLCIGIASAHDCLTDPFNANDCLRTSGFAEGLAGGASALLSGLVNGPIVLQSLAGGGRTSGGESSGAGPAAGAEGVPGATGGPDDNADTVFDGGGGPGQC